MLNSDSTKTALFVTQSLFGGGAERVMAYLCNALAEHGWNVHLIVLQNKKREYETSPKVRLHRFQEDLAAVRAGGKWAKARYIRITARRVNPSVVIAFLYEPIVCAYAATRGLGCQFWSAVRNNPMFYPARKLERIVSDRIFHSSDLCLVQCPGQADLIGLKSKAQFAVVPNPVGEKFISTSRRQTRKARNFIAVGRLEDQKDYPLMLDAFARARESCESIRLDIYGSGSARTGLEKCIHNEGLSDCVAVHGPVTDIHRVLSASDAFIMTSKYEGMPNSLMEAMAIGLPCIALDCETGPRDLINNEVDGLLVSRSNDTANELACQIVRCANDASMCELLGERARKKMRALYSMNAVISKFVSLLERIVS